MLQHHQQQQQEAVHLCACLLPDGPLLLPLSCLTPRQLVVAAALDGAAAAAPALALHLQLCLQLLVLLQLQLLLLLQFQPLQQ
jgi:hypothetical protein